MRRALTAALALALLAACSPPKYVDYTSIHRDWRCRVPWGWNVVTDEQAGSYFATDFMGAFDPDFFLGLPSFSVRWYAYGQAHKLRDGSFEFYVSAEDFIRQTLSGVYGPRAQMIQPVHDVTLSKGLTAKHFIVLSAAPAPKGSRWGMSQDAQTGALVNVRQHAYVVLPLRSGFYVLIYPATRDGYKSYEHRFNELVNTFMPLTEGPSGAPVAAASAVPLAAVR